jgi:cell division inhibitor SepF
MNKALAYLGLKDIEDDEYYLDDYELDETVVERGGRYAEAEAEERNERQAGTTTTLVRPVSTEDPHDTGRAAVVRPLVPNRPSPARVHVVAPARFGDAQEIGDLVKRSNPVIVNLQVSERDLSRRMIDFCSGLTYALGGQMEKVADQVFLLTPNNVEVSAEERMRLQERGLFQS